MLKAFKNALRVPDLKERLLLTLGLLTIYRLGSHIPTPGLDHEALGRLMAQAEGTLLGLFDLFAGGALQRASIFALGIMPYISASIIMQLLIAVIPSLEKMAKEGEEGRKKITTYTRLGTVGLTAFQSFGISTWISDPRSFGGAVLVPHPGLGFNLLTMLTFTAGTTFIMWLGEVISERGIGNGMSLIIFAGIISRLPAAVAQIFQLLVSGEMGPMVFFLLLVLMVVVVAGVVLITQGQRKIPIQYAKRIVGRKVFGGSSTYLPLRVNQAGVIPIIFAASLLMFPATIANFLKVPFLKDINEWISPGGWLYELFYMIFIIFFNYFYTAITFVPSDVADNLKKYGGFIPGIRPGKPTSEHLDRIMSRITLPGGILLAIIAVFPSVISYLLHIPYLVASFFGGTGLLIVVGVALDTAKQMESHLLMHHYEGFMKKGRIRARR